MLDHQPLTAALDATLQGVEALALRHREAEAFQVASARLQFVQAQLSGLLAALRRLRWLSALAAALPAPRPDVWLVTQQDIRQLHPQGLPTLGHGLIAGDADLLAVVAFLGAALQLVQERHRGLVGQLSRDIGVADTAWELRLERVLDDLDATSWPPTAADLRRCWAALL